MKRSRSERTHQKDEKNKPSPEEKAGEKPAINPYNKFLEINFYLKFNHSLLSILSNRSYVSIISSRHLKRPYSELNIG
jgi:hypothetical protein